MKIKDSPSRQVSIRRTRNGPLISDSLNLSRPTAARSLILKLRRTLHYFPEIIILIIASFMKAFLGISESHSWEEFAEAASEVPYVVSLTIHPFLSSYLWFRFKSVLMLFMEIALVAFSE